MMDAILNVFGNHVGLYALLALVPFIIFYLIRPKPKNLALPSLMFLTKISGKRKQTSFFRDLINNLLFFLQLAIIVLLALAVAEPVMKVTQTGVTGDGVLVIDVSASTAVDGVFKKIKSEAKRHLGESSTIILAENVPLVVRERISRNKASEIISNLKPKGTPSNLGESISLASELISDGQVTVISDFKQTIGPDILVAKNQVESKGLGINFIDVGKDVDNVGIINLKITRQKTKIYVKNDFTKTKSVDLKIGSLKHNLKIKQKSIEILTIETPRGITKVEITTKDKFMADNVAYLSSPESVKIKTLLITNEKSSFLKSALESSPNIELKIANPPVIPDLKDYPIIIVHEVKNSVLLPGTFRDIEKHVMQGNNIIFTPQDDMAKLVEKIEGGDVDLLPIEIISVNTNQSTILLDMINKVTKDRDFGIIKKYFITKPKSETINLVSTEDGSAILAMENVGAGKSVYYGIFEKENDFKFSPSFPVFWDALVNDLVKQDLSQFNYKTGTILDLGAERKVKTPSGAATTSSLLIDEIGIYDIGDRKIAANLLDEKESNVGKWEKGMPLLKDSGGKEVDVSKVKSKVNKSLVTVVAIILIILLLLELFYVKLRGDL